MLRARTGACGASTSSSYGPQNRSGTAKSMGRVGTHERAVLLAQRSASFGTTTSTTALLRSAPRPSDTRRPFVHVVSMATSLDASTRQKELYNENMKHAMNNPFEYHPERGLYYHEIVDNLLVGSQPQCPADIRTLVEVEGVTTIFNMQQDQDMRHWNVDKAGLENECRELGVQFVHHPAVDFDPHSLRKILPTGAAKLDNALEDGGRAYVHCTAGLGRSPAMAIAYLFWFKGMSLDKAYEHLTSQRPCGPNRDAIRGATFDIVHGEPFKAFDKLPSEMYAVLSDVEEAVLQHKVLDSLYRYHH